MWVTSMNRGNPRMVSRMAMLEKQHLPTQEDCSLFPSGIENHAPRFDARSTLEYSV